MCHIPKAIPLEINIPTSTDRAPELDGKAKSQLCHFLATGCVIPIKFLNLSELQFLLRQRRSSKKLPSQPYPVWLRR